MATKPNKSLSKTSKADPVPLVSQTPFLEDVRGILREARRKAYATTNFIMVEAYWNIGRRIVEEEQGGKKRADYGSHLIRNLARGSGDEFGAGVSVANLKNFKQFYLTFPDVKKGYALRSQLTWTHWRLVMRVEHLAAREYYIRECAEQDWSTRPLERAIEHGRSRNVLDLRAEGRRILRDGQAITNFDLHLHQPQSDLTREITKGAAA